MVLISVLQRIGKDYIRRDISEFLAEKIDASDILGIMLYHDFNGYYFLVFGKYFLRSDIG